MNELELVTRLRDEVPLAANRRIEDTVLMEIAAAGRGESRRRWSLRANAVRRTRATSRVMWPARPALRPVLAGALAVAVGAGAYAGVELSGSHAAASETMAWSGQPTAPWPSTAHPSYGRASTEQELIAYVTRAAESVPEQAPKPDQWVAVRHEEARSSGGEGGYLFGPPDKRQVTLRWIRGDGCAAASIPPVLATTKPGATVTGKLTVELSGYQRYGCGGGTLGGWKSVAFSYLNSLPTDPAALAGILARSAGPVVAANRDQAIFQSIYTLLEDGESEGVVVPPKLSATMYRVLEQLPGVHFESATDIAGRQGLGFYMVLEGYYKLELVINPDTYTYMGFKDVAVVNHAMKATDGTRYIKAGHVMAWAALLGSAIVDKPGQLPG